MNSPLLLTGHTHEIDPTQPLRERIAELEMKVARLETRQSLVRDEAVIGLLNVLSAAMRQIASGELDLSASAPSGVPTERLDKWEAVKRRVGGKEAELIEVLLTCGPRTNTQLKSLLKLAYSTVAALTLKMSNLGFLMKVGEAWGLKD